MNNLHFYQQAALKAYKKDIENNPDFTGSKIAEIAEASNAKIVIGSSDSKEPKEKKASGKTTPKVNKKWREAKTQEGFSYYWNSETGSKVLLLVCKIGLKTAS